jgi:hypothetical protein
MEETQQMATNPNIREKDKWPVGKPSVLIFDVNETLIDFESMHPLFERIFGDKRAMREWLGHLIMLLDDDNAVGPLQGLLGSRRRLL